MAAPAPGRQRERAGAMTAARIGVVLAGGRATRMGGDKAGAVLAGETLLARAVGIVVAAGLEPRVCARSETALPPVPGLSAAHVWREPTGAGPGGAGRPGGPTDAHPLAGLAHAARTAGSPIVALPVDLPLLPPEVLRALAGHAPADRAAALAVLGDGGRPAALVTRVDATVADALDAAAAAGRPALRTLVELRGEIVDLDALLSAEEARRALTNVNTPGDLLRLERLLRR